MYLLQFLIDSIKQLHLKIKRYECGLNMIQLVHLDWFKYKSLVTVYTVILIISTVHKSYSCYV